MTLTSLGWDDAFGAVFQPWHADGFLPARVSLQHKHACELLAEAGQFTGTCTGRLLHTAASRAELPAVGDWVAVRLRQTAGTAEADIHAVLPRRTKFSRRAPGGGEQVIAANIDVVFLVAALDHSFNLRRLERYLAVAWESGAQPVIVLNKSDLHADPANAKSEAAAIAPGTDVVALSAEQGDDLATLEPWLQPGRTIALLGPSGVGKSTLINRILGHQRQRTSAISAAVGKGRHTTTVRELIAAPSGVLVIDTPGLRELQLWDVDATALDTTFADIAALAGTCRYHDCAHDAEPGCAVRAALEDGTLDPIRWQSFQKLKKEQAHAARRADPRLERKNRANWKKINRQLRARYREKERD